MNLYLLFFALGATGMIAMAILGVAGGHGGARANHGHSVAAHSHGHLGHSATHLAIGARGASKISAAKTFGARGNLKDTLSAWLSPRVLFTFFLGIGATGLLLEPVVSNEVYRALLALAGGLFLEKAIVAPLWELLLRFGSAPARTLESAVLEEAVALTTFDSNGCGLVSITLDGHEMRVLARLQTDDDEDLPPPRVRSGDILLVESVDAARGQCIVSRLNS